MTGLAGCTGGGENEAGAGSTPTPTAASSGSSGGSGGSSDGGGGGGGSDGGSSSDETDEPTATATASADPDCSLLAGSPTPYDASGTPFVFTFDYVDSWTLQDSVQGPGGMIQGIISPTVSVDGETEAAGLTVAQKFEALTAAEAESAAPDVEEYPDRMDVTEQSFGGETVRFYSVAGSDIPFYQAWLPHGDGETRYYELTLMLNTSILRAGGGPTQTLCLETTVAGSETVRQSLVPNPDTTIAEVRDQ